MNSKDYGMTLKDWLNNLGSDTTGVAPYILFARFIGKTERNVVPDHIQVTMYQTSSTTVYQEALPISKLLPPDAFAE